MIFTPMPDSNRLSQIYGWSAGYQTQRLVRILQKAKLHQHFAQGTMEDKR